MSSVPVDLSHSGDDGDAGTDIRDLVSQIGQKASPDTLAPAFCPLIPRSPAGGLHGAAKLCSSHVGHNDLFRCRFVRLLAHPRIEGRGPPRSVHARAIIAAMNTKGLRSGLISACLMENAQGNFT